MGVVYRSVGAASREAIDRELELLGCGSYF